MDSVNIKIRDCCKGFIHQIKDNEIKTIQQEITNLKPLLIIKWNDIGIKERLTKNAISLSSFHIIKESLCDFILGNGGEDIVKNQDYMVFIFECSHKLLDCIFLLKSNFAYYLFSDSIFSTDVYQNPLASFLFLSKKNQNIESTDISDTFFFV